MQLAIYCDGSEWIGKRSKVTIGWGVRAMHSDRTVEVHGGMLFDSDTAKVTRGWYEIMALYQGILHAEEHGYEPHQVTFYTDDEWCVHAGQFLQRGQGHGIKRLRVIRRCREFQKVMYPGNPVALLRLLKWMLHSRVLWVKGHADSVDNCRADYLARHGAKTQANAVEFVQYDDWHLTLRSVSRSAFLQQAEAA